MPEVAVSVAVLSLVPAAARVSRRRRQCATVPSVSRGLVSAHQSGLAAKAALWGRRKGCRKDGPAAGTGSPVVVVVHSQCSLLIRVCVLRFLSWAVVAENHGVTGPSAKAHGAHC